MTSGTANVAGKNGQRTREARSTDDEASVTQAAERVVSSVRTLYGRIDETLREQTATSPYPPLAIAAGVGFVLGGGIASPLGRVLTRLFARSFGPAILDALMNDKSASSSTSGSD